jgi:hypothetical protein
VTDGPRDWRGTEITPGSLVIYGAPVGRSIAMVEATVADPMLSPAGRIWLNVTRRSHGGWGDGTKRVHVGADRLTVVTTLPETDAPTEVEKHTIALAAQVERQRVLTTHHVPAARNLEPAQCTGCGAVGYQQLMAQDCRGLAVAA